MKLTPQTHRNPGPSPRQTSQQSSYQTNGSKSRQQKNTIERQPIESNSHQLSLEFEQNLETFQSITQLDRNLSIRLLQLCKGNVEHAINALYSDVLNSQ